MMLPDKGMHDAAARSIVALTRVRVVVKTEVMTHLMSHRCADFGRLRARVLRSHIIIYSISDG